MARVLLASRVTALEQQMHAIERRFDKLDAQISRFREEMHVALTATNGRVDELRVEVLAALQTTGKELRQADEALRAEMHALHEESMAAIAATGAALERRIDRGDDETRRFMRVLHEDVVERLKRIQNG